MILNFSASPRLCGSIKVLIVSRNIKLTLAYDGTDFAGWQFQTGQRTVQDTLEQTIAKVTGQFSRVTASGRTDAGVHAPRRS